MIYRTVGFSPTNYRESEIARELRVDDATAEYMGLAFNNKYGTTQYLNWWEYAGKSLGQAVAERMNTDRRYRLEIKDQLFRPLAEDEHKYYLEY